MKGTGHNNIIENNEGLLTTTTWGTRFAFLSLVALLAAGLALADGKSHKLSKDLDALKSSHDGGTVDVIVQYNTPPTDAQHQKVQGKGGTLKAKLDIIKGAHYSVPVDALSTLADDPDIAYVSPNRPLTGHSMSTLDFTPETVNAPWHGKV